MPADIDTFSYAAPEDPKLKRFLIRLIERMTGQPKLKRIYDAHRAEPVPGRELLEFRGAAPRSEDRRQ